MSDYVVVLLAEQALTEVDVRQVRSLHTEVPDPVVYQLLIPVENAAMRVETALGSMTGGDIVAASPAAFSDIDEVQAELTKECEEGLASSLSQLRESGGHAEGRKVPGDPIEALVATVEKYDGREVIVLTRPHVVAEFFHLDWANKARRKLGVPVLHLIEHETFDEQAGEGEGVTGL